MSAKGQKQTSQVPGSRGSPGPAAMVGQVLHLKFDILAVGPDVSETKP